jgi:hypothetical protein
MVALICGAFPLSIFVSYGSSFNNFVRLGSKAKLGLDNDGEKYFKMWEGQGQRGCGFRTTKRSITRNVFFMFFFSILEFVNEIHVGAH